MNFNKRKVALSLMAALAWGGVSSVSAETLTADFNSGLPAGWSIVGDLTRNSDRARSGSGVWTSSKSTTDNYVITEEVEGTFEFYARAYNKSYASTVVVYEYTGSGLGSQLYTTGSMYTSSTPSWSKYSFKVESGCQLAIVLNYAAIDDVTYTQKEVADGPALIVKDGSKVTSPYAFDFGLATAGTSKTFTLSNPGTKAVEGLAVSTNDFNATLSATTIAAGGEATLTITMPETTASNTFTLSSTTTGIEPFVFNVSGTVKDPNKMFEDFSGNALPDGWDAQGNSYTWNFTNGYAGYGGYSATYSGSLTTKKLSFTAGEKFFFDAKINATYSASSASITVQTSEDGIEFTDLETIGSAQMSNSAWNSFSVTIPSANVKYIRFANCIYAAIDNVYGGNLPLEPNMKFEASDYSFGMISADATTAAYTIQNTGLAELTGVTVVSSNAQFTVSDVPATIAAKGQATFTVTMKSDVKGLQEGKITVSADGFDAVEFNVSGYVLDNDVIVVDFAGNTVPEGWTNNGFTVSNNELSTTYTTCTLTSPAITVADGQKLIVYAKGNSTYYARLTVKTSTDNGNTFTTAKEFTTEIRNNTTDYEVLVVDNIPAGNYILQFEGYQVTINTINGYTYNMNAPAISVTPAEDAAFGKVTATPEAKTYTVANTGTGKMTVNIASSSEDFTVSPATIEDIENGAPQTFTVTFNYKVESLGDKEADITVTPTYNAEEAVSFKATATAKDPNVWEEDFEAGTFAEGWIANNWSISTPGSYSGGNGTKMAGGSSNSATLITPRLEATEGQSLSFDLGGSGSSWPLVVEYSTDRNTWNAIETFTEDGTKTINAPLAGNFYLRFTGYVYIDNITGFKLSPLEHDAIIKAQNVPATGTQYVEYTASVTVEEMAGKAEELTAQFFIGDTQYGENVTETVEANGTKTFTVTFTTEEPVSGDAYFTVSNADIKLESTKTAVKIAAATVIDEDEINEFEEGRLAAVVLNYAKGAGKWGTIALPFQTTAADLATAFGVSEIKAFGYKSSAENSMTFQPATSTMYAGYVYVIYSDKALNGAKFFDVQVTAPTAKSDGESTKLQATYAPVDMEGKWGITPDGNIMQGLAGASLKAMRGYITTITEARLSLIIEDTTSGITTVMEAGDLNEQQAVYNLQGQKMQQAGKGLYIVNGKKMVRK